MELFFVYWWPSKDIIYNIHIWQIKGHRHSWGQSKNHLVNSLEDKLMETQFLNDLQHIWYLLTLISWQRCYWEMSLWYSSEEENKSELFLCLNRILKVTCGKCSSSQDRNLPVSFSKQLESFNIAGGAADWSEKNIFKWLCVADQ